MDLTHPPEQHQHIANDWDIHDLVKEQLEERCQSIMDRAEVADATSAELVEPSKSGVPAEPHHGCHHGVGIGSYSSGSHARQSPWED
ncbi:hypothetical protein Scep_004141 [Stephania cephalantha]|uniref:Uncharacterized protein n=1 Tax=Stephania cephalantha TaxID=152367 RepID=A0AAP0PV32_9MAGN